MDNANRCLVLDGLGLLKECENMIDPKNLGYFFKKNIIVT